jgi:hypothetical protein
LSYDAKGWLKAFSSRDAPEESEKQEESRALFHTTFSR